MPIAELAAFVGRFVVCALAADEDDRPPRSLAAAYASSSRATRCAYACGAGPDRSDLHEECAVPQFLSDEWMDEAKKIREEYVGEGARPAAQGADEPGDHRRAPRRRDRRHRRRPHGHEQRRARDGHRATSTSPELTVTVDYETAKAIFVDQNPQAGMQAFMAGKIKVQGDMTKLMAMQQGAPDPKAAEVAARIQSITD